MTLVTLRNAEELAALLSTRGIDLSQWDKGRTKTVADLWEEIVAGETQMRDNPLQRIVLGVVEVMIRKGEDILIESRQEFSSGLIRSRNIPPSEKMKPGEHYLDTARRCLCEEFNVSHDAIEMVGTSYRTRQAVELSKSYPGLETLYTFHTVEARVRGISESDFSTDEYGEDGRERLVTHYWVWQKRGDRGQ